MESFVAERQRLRKPRLKGPNSRQCWVGITTLFSHQAALLPPLSIQTSKDENKGRLLACFSQSLVRPPSLV